MMSFLPPCCDEFATCWLVLAFGASGDFESEGLLGDAEEAK